MDPNRHFWPLIWITGLAGAGKTTLAAMLFSEFKPRLPNLVHIDGDAVREMLGDDLGHSETDRLKNAYRIAKLCEFLNGQGLAVICSTMSLFPEIWQWNRVHFPNYRQVYLRVSQETLRGRDKKQLYSKSSQGLQNDVVGFQQAFIEPLDSDLILDNDLVDQKNANVQALIELLNAATSKSI